MGPKEARVSHKLTGGGLGGGSGRPANGSSGTMSRAEKPSAATASATCQGATSLPMTQRARTVSSCQRWRTRCGQRRRKWTRGSPSIVSSCSTGLPVRWAIIPSSARTVRPRANATQSSAVSVVATPASRRTCVHVSSPRSNAAATGARRARHSATRASACSSRAERPRRSRAKSPRRANPSACCPRQRRKCRARVPSTRRPRASWRARRRR